MVSQEIRNIKIESRSEPKITNYLSKKRNSKEKTIKKANSDLENSILQ